MIKNCGEEFASADTIHHLCALPGARIPILQLVSVYGTKASRSYLFLAKTKTDKSGEIPRISSNPCVDLRVRPWKLGICSQNQDAGGDAFFRRAYKKITAIEESCPMLHTTIVYDVTTDAMVPFNLPSTESQGRRYLLCDMEHSLNLNPWIWRFLPGGITKHDLSPHTCKKKPKEALLGLCLQDINSSLASFPPSGKK